MQKLHHYRLKEDLPRPPKFLLFVVQIYVSKMFCFCANRSSTGLFLSKNTFMYLLRENKGRRLRPREKQGKEDEESDRRSSRADVEVEIYKHRGIEKGPTVFLILKSM